uniref:Uncharacterized protein n=1 Tax=Medicago truncatula TaxID=3880 RepID=A2Q1T5_MEDTR|nr:hypothetical protein MtrDRAFT_AC149040g38v2 [Medicago truncatula]
MNPNDVLAANTCDGSCTLFYSFKKIAVQDKVQTSKLQSRGSQFSFYSLGQMMKLTSRLIIGMTTLLPPTKTIVNCFISQFF